MSVSRKSRLKPIDEALFRELWAGPLLTAEIGERVGLSLEAARYRAYRMNLPYRHNVKRHDAWPAKKIARMQSLLWSGLSYGKVAKILKTTRCAVAGQVHRLKYAVKREEPEKILRRRRRPPPPSITPPVRPAYITAETNSRDYWKQQNDAFVRAMRGAMQ